jgi:hypothetical protein
MAREERMTLEQARALIAAEQAAGNEEPEEVEVAPYSLEAVAETLVNAISDDVAFRKSKPYLDDCAKKGRTPYLGTVVKPYFKLAGTAWSLYEILADKWPEQCTKDKSKQVMADACSGHPRLTYTQFGKIGLDLGTNRNGQVVRTATARPRW